MKFVNRILKTFSAAQDVVPAGETNALPVEIESDNSNVVPLPARNPIAEPAGLSDSAGNTACEAPQHKGLLDYGVIHTFISTNHFGRGQHDGARLKTQQGQEMGRQALLSQFQTLLAQTANQKQNAIDKLRNMQLQTRGVCATTTEQIELAIARQQRDMELLNQQSVQCASGQGWVLKALNEYQQGYAAGVRLAVDAELLNL